MIHLTGQKDLNFKTSVLKAWRLWIFTISLQLSYMW